MNPSPGIAGAGARLVVVDQPPSAGRPVVPPGIETGQQLAARVLRVLGDGQFIIDLQGTELRARSAAGLSAGQSFMVEVAGQEPLLTLRLLLPSAELDAEGIRRAALLFAARPNIFSTRLNGLMELLGERRSPALDVLRQAADLFRPASLLAALREGTTSLAGRLGLDWESQLAARIAADLKPGLPGGTTMNPGLPAPAEQLKAALFETLKWLRTAPESPEFVRSMTGMVRDLLGLVECNQYLNNVGLRGFDGLFLILPLWGDGREADLWIRYRREGAASGGGEGEQHSLLFALDLPDFGRVASRVGLDPRRVTVALRVAGEPQRQAVEPLLADSRVRLAGILRREVLIDVQVEAGVPAEWQRELLERLPSMVDCHA